MNQISLEVLKDLANDYIANSPRESLHIPQFRIKANKFSHEVKTDNIVKDFKATSSKRVILSNGDTVPFGFKF